jgi:hypothetical protein
MIAGSLAFLIEIVAVRSGKMFRGFFVGSAVFLIGARRYPKLNIQSNMFATYSMIKIRGYVYSPLAGFAATYLRFFPKIKKNYDYGVVIFLLTFNLITVSSFRQEDVVPLARDRLCTIVIGCAICLFMSLLVLPNWSGEDLHNCTVRKFEGLAKSIEGAYQLAS